MQRIIMRVLDALMVTVSRHVIRVKNTVTTSNLEALEVDLNGTTFTCMSNYFSGLADDWEDSGENRGVERSNLGSLFGFLRLQRAESSRCRTIGKKRSGSIL